MRRVVAVGIAAAALRLVERGVLSLDEPIGRQGLVLPEPVAFAGDFTLRQLLSHTSGLAEMVLEAKTGRSLTDLLREEIVDPLDLRATALLDDATTETPPQYALVHESAQPVEPPRLFKQAFPLTRTLVTTAIDAATFAHALFTGDVLEPASLDEMLDTGAMRGLPCPADCRFEYGLGVFHFDEPAGRALVGHDGSSGTIVVHDRDRDLTVAILTNGGEQDLGAFLEAVLKAIGGT